MMHAYFRRLTGLAAATLAFSACSDSSGSNMGTLTVRLTDAPFPFSEVSRVDVHVVSVQARSEEPTEGEAADESRRGGWTTIATPDASFNLLDLAGGVTTNLGAATLATGTYNGFRLILDTDRSTITLKDGSTPPIKWPSAAQTGIKIYLDEPIELTEDGSVMTLDFDVGRSFVLRGTLANGFIFTPVIRAVAEDITGTVTGSVRASSATGAGVAGATVEVLTAGSLLADNDPAHIVQTTATDANGDFRFAFLLPGTYVLRATPPAASGFKPALLPGGLTITSGTVTSGQIIVVAP